MWNIAGARVSSVRMDAIATPAPEPELTPEPQPRERPAWGFPIGCAVVVALGFFVPWRRAPRPSPPEPARVVSASEPFAEDVPYSPAAIAEAKPLVDPRWFLPSVAPSATVRTAAPVISGRLPPAVVQRAAHASLGRHRRCYEDALRSNPNLQGRVVVRFVIGRDGAVSAASNGGSDLPDARMVDCIVRSFHGLSFPRPAGGIVTVAVPIHFAPR